MKITTQDLVKIAINHLESYPQETLFVWSIVDKGWRRRNQTNYKNKKYLNMIEERKSRILSVYDEIKSSVESTADIIE